jgi:branched-chain amino acid transport system ATP-binding protein
VLAGLRPGECDRVIQVLLEIHQRDGMTIVMIEHVMRAVMALAKQIVVLHHGEVIAAGAPEAIVRDPRVLECYLGEETPL